jgi:hypothetical protein
MPEQTTEPVEVKPVDQKEVGVKYYKTTKYGLTVFKDGDENSSIRFQPFFEKFQGDDIRVGYLSVSDKGYIKVLDEDLSVEEITKKEFDEATGDKARPASYAVA